MIESRIEQPQGFTFTDEAVGQGVTSSLLPRPSYSAVVSQGFWFMLGPSPRRACLTHACLADSDLVDSDRLEALFPICSSSPGTPALPSSRGASPFPCIRDHDTATF